MGKSTTDVRRNYDPMLNWGYWVGWLVALALNLALWGPLMNAANWNVWGIIGIYVLNYLVFGYLGSYIRYRQLLRRVE